MLLPSAGKITRLQHAPSGAPEEALLSRRKRSRIRSPAVAEIASGSKREFTRTRMAARFPLRRRDILDFSTTGVEEL